MAVPTVCIDCGNIAQSNRCKTCTKLRNKERNAKPNRRAYQDPVYRSFVKALSCGFCGSTVDLTKDHKHPLAKGGGNDYGNLQTLCRRCNAGKGSNLMH